MPLSSSLTWNSVSRSIVMLWTHQGRWSTHRRARFWLPKCTEIVSPSWAVIKSPSSPINRTVFPKPSAWPSSMWVTAILRPPLILNHRRVGSMLPTRVLFVDIRTERVIRSSREQEKSWWPTGAHTIGHEVWLSHPQAIVSFWRSVPAAMSTSIFSQRRPICTCRRKSGTKSVMIWCLITSHAFSKMNSLTGLSVALSCSSLSYLPITEECRCPTSVCQWLERTTGSCRHRLQTSFHSVRWWQSTSWLLRRVSQGISHWSTRSNDLWSTRWCAGDERWQSAAQWRRKRTSLSYRISEQQSSVMISPLPNRSVIIWK